MKMWTRLGIGVVAIALAIAAGTGAYAMRGGRDGSPKQATQETDTQQKRAADDSAGTMAMCVAEVPDCNDMVVLPEGDQARCAADAGTCIDTPCVGGPAVDCMAPEPSGVCYSLDTEPITTQCVDTGCAQPMPVDPPTDVEPVPGAPEDAPGGGVLTAPAEENGTIGVGCLGEDPCTISSEMKCLPPDCAISSDGTIFCPEPVPCEVPPVDVTPITIEPDATAVAEGGSTRGDEPAPPATEPCVIDPCFGNDPYAGIPENCPPLCEPPAAPNGSTEPAMPCAAPCDQPDPEGLVHPCAPIDPCVSPDQPATEPEGDVRECPPSTGGGAPGSSGSSSSGAGVVEPAQPAQ
ncbi:MAG: hypothetical protein HY873_01000 [Chloroflexi bacterium]|nr:hypothetical protein [Chloroflexota bacterium]